MPKRGAAPAHWQKRPLLELSLSCRCKGDIYSSIIQNRRFCTDTFSMLDTRLTQVFSHPSLMAMANRGLPNQMPILKDNHCWLPHLQRGGPMGPGSAVFPIQPLRPLAFMATGSHPHIPQTISPVNHQHLNDLINNREGSPTPTEGMNFKSNRKKSNLRFKRPVNS